MSHLHWHGGESIVIKGSCDGSAADWAGDQFAQTMTSIHQGTLGAEDGFSPGWVSALAQKKPRWINAAMAAIAGARSKLGLSSTFDLERSINVIGNQLFDAGAPRVWSPRPYRPDTLKLNRRGSVLLVDLSGGGYTHVANDLASLAMLGRTTQGRALRTYQRLGKLNDRSAQELLELGTADLALRQLSTLVNADGYSLAVRRRDQQLLGATAQRLADGTTYVGLGMWLEEAASRINSEIAESQTSGRDHF